jgi:hypothetical protein
MVRPDMSQPVLNQRYVAPRVTIHGNVRTLTLGVPQGVGEPLIGLVLNGRI